LSVSIAILVPRSTISTYELGVVDVARLVGAVRRHGNKMCTFC
jgi:hypothetical protein